MACLGVSSRVQFKPSQKSVAAPGRSHHAKPKVGRTQRLVVRAESADSSVDVEKLLKDLQEKWDKVENKTSVAVYGAGALVAVWLSGTLVSAVNAVPLLPRLMELVGLGYTAWFVWRYLLFKSSREELGKEIEEIKKKIAGTE